MGNSRVGGGCYFERMKAVKIMPTLLHYNTCIAQGDAISKKFDLSLDANGQKRN